MVAKAKNQKSGGRKDHKARVRATKVHARKLEPARGASLKASGKPTESADVPRKGENGFHKPGEPEKASIIPKPEEPVAPRERSSYDGDTAIKLYLREIGQVKLLT